MRNQYKMFCTLHFTILGGTIFIYLSHANYIPSGYLMKLHKDTCNVRVCQSENCIMLFLLRMRCNLGKLMVFHKRTIKNITSRTTTLTLLVRDVFNIENRRGLVCWFQVHSSTIRLYFYELIQLIFNANS